MKVSITDNGRVFNYDEMFRMSMMRDSNELVINYIDENGEVHQEVGPIPEHIGINDFANAKWEPTVIVMEGRKYAKNECDAADAYMCDYCGYQSYLKTNYCPWCGSKMQDECELVKSVKEATEEELRKVTMPNKSKADCSSCKYSYPYKGELNCYIRSGNYIFNPDGHCCNKYERKEDKE